MGEMRWWVSHEHEEAVAMPPPEFDESAGMQAYGRVVWPMCVRSGGRGHRMEDCLGRRRFRERHA